MARSIAKLVMSLTAAALVGAMAAGCAAPSGAAANGPLPPATAQITRTTLVETRTEPGTLGYGELAPISAASSGTVTWMAPVGSTVARGEPLFKVDEQPVVALYGAVPMYRAMEEGLSGADVQQLQENLAELGYTGFNADGSFGAATTRAVRAWQADLGLPQTGSLDPGQVVFVPGPVRLAEHAARVGDAVRGAPVLHYSGTDRIVTVQLRVADIGLALEGNAVPVHVPGRGTVQGEIAHVGSVISNGMIAVTITIDDQEALGALEAAPVEVDFVSQEREGVLAVPVAALLALAEGGYGLEIVEGNTTRIVPVRTGMFAAGRVEVSGDGIVEGMTVGVAR
jgi:membrane fusion protein, multidrug efflux system